MAESETSWGVWIMFIILFIWVAAITILLVAVYFHKVNVIGETGPTGPTGPAVTTTTTLLSGPIGAVGGIQGTQVISANGAGCYPCSFYNANDITGTSQYQIIPVGKPQNVKWVLTTNNLNSNYNQGVFILDPGTYSVSIAGIPTSVMYPSVMHTGQSNMGGTYRRIAIWLRSQNDDNMVYEQDLIGITTEYTNGSSAVTISFPTTLQFHVTSKNKFSIITWHDASIPLEIGGLSRFNLVKFSL